MTATASFSPVSLSYVAALRGVKPRRPGEAFTYALAHCASPEFLVGLAASNPEGQFYGLSMDADFVAEGGKIAAERQVTNVTFLNTKAGALLKDGSAMPALDYLACDESQKALTHIERAALFDLAAKSVKPSGLFCYSYRAYDNPTDALRFMVREFAPEMDADQAQDFLLEIKKLGHLYLQSNADIAAKLDQAIAKNLPDEFFMLFDDGDARSATFDTLVALRTRGMSFSGSGNVQSNYVELSVPVEAQAIVMSCRDNPLYEPMKDFSSLTAIRADIWCKQPAMTSSVPAELFGGFAYGITMAAEKVPASVDVFGKSVDLSSPLFQSLIGLMSLQPISIGDALQHSDSKHFEPAKIVEAMQVLVALNIARPMRGAHEAGTNISSLAQPRFSGSFNRYIDQMAVAGKAMAMASKILGDVIEVSPRDALVMQALNRAGLANSVAALLPELERLAKDPSSAAKVTDVTTPTLESAHQMINDAVSQSIIQWYAYGLLEAA